MYVFGLCPQFLAHSLQISWNSLSVESNIGVFCFVIKVKFGSI